MSLWLFQPMLFTTTNTCRSTGRKVPLSTVVCMMGAPLICVALFLHVWLNGDLRCSFCGEHCHQGVLLTRRGFLCLKQCLGGFHGSKSIHLKARTLGFPLENDTVVRWSMVLTTTFRSFTVANWCLSVWTSLLSSHVKYTSVLIEHGYLLLTMEFSIVVGFLLGFVIHSYFETIYDSFPQTVTSCLTLLVFKGHSD